jgi:DNA-binding response OmpR family regulator
MASKRHILLVEDDESMGFLLKDSLENFNYEVSHYSDGESALSDFSEHKFDLCLLDVMMPKMDGFTLASEIRRLDANVPLVFLTAKTLKEDRIQGFKIGADDYITKPFSVEELDLRMQAILRRGNTIKEESEKIIFSNCELDKKNLILSIGENQKQLTHKEAEILALLAGSVNTLLKRDYILKVVWEDNGYFVGRSLDVFISKLRKYLKPDANIEIVNIHGEGYKFVVTE